MNQTLPPNGAQDGAGSSVQAMDIDQRIDDLMFICERFNALLEKENAALDAQDMDTLEGLLEEKELLCRAYENRGRPLLDHPEELDDADPDLREQLRDMVYKVEVNIRGNARRLAVEVASSKMFFDTLADAVREHTPKSGVYGNNGKVDGKVVAAPHGVPLSYDQSL